MIVNLTIRDIVLIDRLHMTFEDGLCVLSGETGAGKSILLSGIGLAIGARGGKELIRHGQETGSVSIEFNLDMDHKIWGIFDDYGLEYEKGKIILRRIIMNDGRSRAFVNDQSVSISLLREIGEHLIEIHGQHDERGLLNSSSHRDLLDNFGTYEHLRSDVEGLYAKLTMLRKALQQAVEALDLAKTDEDYIRYNLTELVDLNPSVGEEEELAKERSRMMQGENLSEGLNELLDKLTSDKGADATLRATLRKIERMTSQAPGILEDVSASLDRAASETSEAIGRLEQIVRDLEFNPYDLENTEERLFALRAAARKHNCQSDQLVLVKEDFENKLAALEYGDDEVRKLTSDAQEATVAFENVVSLLTQARKKTARELDEMVNKELPALKMDKAQFKTFIEPLERQSWNDKGGERIGFEVSTNPGAPFGGLIKIASGGELSRFILALKVVLARKASVATLIFDEIDQGVGGAVANAVGERLAILAQKAQILVITHSPQVAARGKSHWLIEKNDASGKGEYLTTAVTVLTSDQRREEIARMLAGAEVTNEARAAADNLLRL